MKARESAARPVARRQPAIEGPRDGIAAAAQRGQPPAEIVAAIARDGQDARGRSALGMVRVPAHAL